MDFIKQSSYNIGRFPQKEIILLFFKKILKSWKKTRFPVPMAKEVPIWQKSNLTLEEAAAYSGIGMGKLRELTNARNCAFVLWVGNKRLIKKRLFDQYIEQTYSI